MAPVTIASLTVLVLIGLIIEYYTRMISRGLRQALRLATPVTQDHAAGEAVPRHIELRTFELETGPAGDSRSSYMPPGFASAYAPSARSQDSTSNHLDRELTRATRPQGATVPGEATHAAMVSGLGGSIPSREQPEVRASAAIMSIVGELIRVENELTRDLRLGGNRMPLDRLKTLAVYYDLDELMQISESALNKRVIVFYREVARLVLDLEELLRNVAILGSLDDGAGLLEQACKARRAEIAEAIESGMRLAECLSQRTAGAAIES